MEQMRTNMSQLNNELNNLSRQLTKQNIKLEQLNKLKNQFLGMAAHDLRNPIGNILMYSEFILENQSDFEPTEMTKVIHIIRESSEYMLNFIDELLNVVKIESEKFDLKKTETDIAKIIRNSYDLNSLLAQKKHLKISLNLFEKMPVVLMDYNKKFLVFFLLN